MFWCVQDEFSHLVQQWNLQRSQALERALTKLLYPQMEKELRAKLLSEAKDGIVKVRQKHSMSIRALFFGGWGINKSAIVFFLVLFLVFGMILNLKKVADMNFTCMSHSCHWYLYCFPWFHDACFNWPLVVDVCFDWSFVIEVYFDWLLVVEVCSDWSVGVL